MVQATETVKLLLGIGEPLIGRLLTYDALGMRFREVRLRRDPEVPALRRGPDDPGPVDPRRRGRGLRAGRRRGRGGRSGRPLRPAPRRQRGARGAAASSGKRPTVTVSSCA